jgi:dTDP-L-rhamnose 4-epimerase
MSFPSIFINDIFIFINGNRRALRELVCRHHRQIGNCMAKTYLLTGGAGFIGRHLCRDLLSQGHTVRVIDAMIDQVHCGADSEILAGIEFIRGDVRDTRLLARNVPGVDGVFHLAAEVGVGQSMYEVARYVGANDFGTAVLLEQLIRTPVERLVVASSMSVYGEGAYRTDEGDIALQVRRSGREGSLGWDPILADGRRLTPAPTDETKQVDLASIYALTKYSQERSCLIVGRAYGIQTAALRLFNVFGPGQALSNPYTGVLANFGSRLRNGQGPLVFEDGQQKRDFVHVADVARAFRLAMESPAAPGHVINIGSGHSYTIAAVAEMLAAAMGVPDLRPQILGKARAGDIRHCFADIGKARALLGYAPSRLLEDSLDELVEWINASEADDRGDDAKRHLEVRGLVA